MKKFNVFVLFYLLIGIIIQCDLLGFPTFSPSNFCPACVYFCHRSNNFRVCIIKIKNKKQKNTWIQMICLNIINGIKIVRLFECNRWSFVNNENIYITLLILSNIIAIHSVFHIGGICF